MFNKKQNVVFTSTQHTIIYTKWAEGWYDGVKELGNTYTDRLMSC